MDHVGSLLLGLGNGGVIAGLAVALVLTYRSSGVLNFATGAIALYGAYTYASLREGELLLAIPGLPDSIDLGGPLDLIPAILVALLVNAVLGALLYLLVFRPLRTAPPLARAMASLGVLIIIQEMLAIRVGTEPVNVTAIFPLERWDFWSVTVISDRFYLAVSMVALALVLVVVFRFTRFGLLTRANADTETGAYVSGVSPDRVALLNWMISAVVAGLAGILIAPIVPLQPATYTLLVVPALAAALVGGFQNVLITVAAGIGIGMLQSEVVGSLADQPWLPRVGASELIPLIVILITLLITGRALPERGGLLRHPLGRAPRPRVFLTPTVVGVVFAVIGLVWLEGPWRASLISSFIFGIIALSLVVVTGFAGLVSLAQITLAGAGAFVLSFLTQSWGIPFPIAPVLAALVAAAVGVLVGLPALRVRGLALGVVTLAFAYAIEAVWFRNSDIVDAGGADIPPPEMFGIDLSIGSGTAAFPRLEFGLMSLLVLVVVALSVARLRTSALGSAMLAVRANERSAAGLGVNVTRVKVLSFAIAAFIAGLGGSLIAYRFGNVTFLDFATLRNLALLSTAYLAGVTSVSGGVLAGIMAAEGIIFTALDRGVDVGDWFGVISGVALILTLILNPEGIAAINHEIAQRIPLRWLRLGRRVRAAVAGAPEAPPPAEGAGPTLRIADLKVRYGGVVAVDGVDIEVAPGTVVGLIGPNGAGKTSVIDAVTGFTRATGDVRIDDESLAGMAPHSRVRRGVARTFQSLELYDDLSVEENVSVSALAGQTSDRPAAVTRALDLVGIGALRDRPAGQLSQGERQLVSIARACAADPAILLLDEPAAGLDTTESVALGVKIRGIAEAGAGVLLVDHDVTLVLSLCDHVYVLDFGKTIAEGTPAEIRADGAVARAYLGTTHDTSAVTT